MEKRWYVVHTYSGYEDKVKLGIEEKVNSQGLSEMIGRILIPTERVVELKRGKKKESDKKFYPGYILVEMELNDESWHLVKSVPKVTGFVGGTTPMSLPEEEMELILQQQEKGTGQEVKMQFGKGENVRITDGPFSNFNGYVDEVDIDHGRLKVMVSIFGRQTPVELSFYQVEKS
ncbi:MAG: transcription termination/antitermination protein NusG [Nitrospirae bacterium]|nr:transcription termination/antitermination protein NusG [Nitrospirota bacterium]